MSEPPEPATDEHPAASSPPTPPRPRRIVGPVDTFARVDPPQDGPAPEPRVTPEPDVPVEPQQDPERIPPVAPTPERDRAPTEIISLEEIEAARAGERSSSADVPPPTAPTDGELSTTTPGGDDAGGGGGPVDPGPRASSAWWRFGFPAAMVALVLAIPALVWVGTRVLLDSDEGKVVAAVTDPTEPGWEAVVDPTPVHTLVVSNAEGGLDHVVVQFLTGSASGGVVVLPADTLFDSGAYGDVPLSRIFDNGGGADGGGAEAIRGSLETILGIGMDEIQVIEPEEWGPLVRPVAPLTVNNPDDVSGTDTGGQQVSFPKGSLEVSAAEVWPYLSAEVPGESAINRAYRIEAFWRGWLAAVNAAGDTPGSVPGEIDSGLGYFVRSLAGGATEVTTLPVAPMTGPEGEAWFQPQEEAVQALIATVDPYPAGPLGERLRLRVLDGTGKLDHGLGAAKLLAANGGQIDKVGNALNFDHQTTQLVFYDPALRPKVQALRDALGIGELVQSDELNIAEDVTVVLGQDYLPLADAASSGGDSAGG